MLGGSTGTRVRTVLARTVLLAAVLAALAAPAAATPLASMDLTLLAQSMGTGNPLLLVAGQLPDDAELPAEIVLPIPEGAVVEWSGEIFGGPVENDPAVEAVIEEREGGSVAILTLTESRVGQIEVTFPGSVAPADGGAIAIGFDMVAPVEAGQVRLAIALPPGGQPVELLPDTLSAPGPEGYTYFYQEFGETAPGDPVAFSLTYQQQVMPPAAAPGTTQPSSEVPPLLIILVGAVLAGAVLIVVASRSSSRGAAAPEAIEHEEADEAVSADETVPASSEPASSYVEDADPSVPASPPPAPPASGWLTPQRLLIVAAVLIVGIVLAVILGGQQGQVGVTEISDGWISQRISTASAESAVEFTIRITCACPPVEEAPKIFEALRQVPGVAHAALHDPSLVLRVEYDPATTSEGSIAARLQAAGYLP